MIKSSYIVVFLAFLCACGESKKPIGDLDSQIKLPNCTSDLLQKLKDPNTEISEIIAAVKSTHKNCRIDPEFWRSIIEDSSFSEEHRVNALYGLIITEFKPGMDLRSFLAFVDGTGAYGVKGDFRWCRNPSFFVNKKLEDIVYMCNPLGNVCVRDSLNYGRCYGFSIQVSDREGSGPTLINRDAPTIHEKKSVDAILLSGRDWHLMIEKKVVWRFPRFYWPILR